MLGFVFQKSKKCRKYLMSKVNQTRLLVSEECSECKYGLNETVCNSKQKCNHGECSISAKNYIIGVLVKVIIFGILVSVIVSVIRHIKLMNI